MAEILGEEFDPSLRELFLTRREHSVSKGDVELRGRIWRNQAGASIVWLPSGKNIIGQIGLRDPFICALEDFGKHHDDSLEVYIARVTRNTDVLSRTIPPEILCEVLSTVIQPVPLDTQPGGTHHRIFGSDVIK